MSAELPRGSADVVGVEEHPVPGWWTLALFVASALALGLWFRDGVFHAVESPAEAYRRTRVTAESLRALARDPAVVREGRSVFAQTCVSCHGAAGGGGTGPNLTDAYWLHGAGPDEIYRTVSRGVSDKGMPAWGGQLGAERVQNVVAYVLTLRNTRVPGGKAPQGALVP